MKNKNIQLKEEKFFSFLDKFPQLRREWKNIEYAIVTLRYYPIDAMSQLLPVGIVCISLVLFVIALFLFILQGAFFVQVGMITGDETVKFTKGNVDILISGIASNINMLLIALEIILLTIQYLASGGIIKKILVSCYLFFSMCCMGILGLIIGNKAPLFLQCVGLVFVGILLLMLWCSNYKMRIKKLFKVVLITYIIFPIVLLLVENFIPLCIKSIWFLVLGAVLLWILRPFLNISNQQNNEFEDVFDMSRKEQKVVEKSTYNHEYLKKGVEDRKDKKIRTLTIEKDCAYIPDYNRWGGFKLYKVKGSTDCIKSYNGITHRYICRLEELQKGRFKIYDANTMREIKVNEIPWEK